MMLSLKWQIYFWSLMKMLQHTMFGEGIPAPNVRPWATTRIRFYRWREATGHSLAASLVERQPPCPVATTTLAGL